MATKQSGAARGRKVAAEAPVEKPFDPATTIEVVLGKKPYTLRPLTLGPARRWRESLKGPFERLMALLQGAPQIDITNVQQLVSVLRLAGDVLIEAPDMVADLLWTYAPDVFTDEERAWLDENAYDSEIVPAFIKCLRQVYPLEALMNSLGR